MWLLIRLLVNAAALCFATVIFGAAVVTLLSFNVSKHVGQR